jgi:AraC family transcriptional regulator
MSAPSEGRSIGEFASGAGQNWLGASVWQALKIEISKIKSLPSITAMSYHRDGGEATWRSDRHRLILARDPRPPMVLQVEQGSTWETPLAAPGTLSYCPAGLTIRTIQSAASHAQVVWDTDLYSTLLPELGAVARRFEFHVSLQDPLLSQIVTTLAEDAEGGFADLVLVESLSTALCIRLARHFVGHPPLPTSKGLSPKRLQRVRDYVEAHLDEDVSLTVLADIAGLSPYHFSRSFKQATGAGPRRYVIQRRVERAKYLLRQTDQSLALIAQEVGFADQSHLTKMFHREMGVTPGRLRAELAGEIGQRWHGTYSTTSASSAVHEGGAANREVAAAVESCGRARSPPVLSNSPAARMWQPCYACRSNRHRAGTMHGCFR